VDLGQENGSDGERSGDEEEWDPDGVPLAPAERAARRAERLYERNQQRQRRRQERQARRNERKQQMNDYYQESYYAMPAAISLFRMAQQRNSGWLQEMLWLASVSLVGYHDLGLISDIEYDVIACNYLKEAYDLGEATWNFSQGMSQDSAKQDSAMMSDEEEMTPGKPPMPARMRRGKRSLRFESDLRLTLYKHWTLEESVMNSPYFYGAFKLHRDKGVRLLKGFFAKAGIMPNQYRQLYGAMKIPVRKKIQKKFREHGKEHGMIEGKMFLDQFVREHGLFDDEHRALFLNELSCSDAVHIVLAHLSCVPAVLSGASMDKLPVNEDGLRDLLAIKEMERKAMEDNFWRASDAISNKEPGCLKEGLGLAVEVVKAVQQMARRIVDTKAMRKCSHFRWCKVEQPGHIFRHGLSVRRLAVWILKVFFSEHSGANGDSDKPLLMIMHDRVRETYLCVGATPKKGSGDGDYFGHIFRAALRPAPGPSAPVGLLRHRLQAPGEQRPPRQRGGVLLLRRGRHRGHRELPRCHGVEALPRRPARG